MSDADKPDDVNGRDDADKPSSLIGDTRPFFPKSTLDAINFMFRTGGAFDALLKPGGAFDPQISKGFQTLNPGLNKALEDAFEPQLAGIWRDHALSVSRNLAAAAALNYPSYKTISVESSTAYSPEMKGPADYFQPWESVIDSFAGLQEAVARISRHHPSSTFLWRGQQDADWPLHSSLFRHVWKAKGVRDPSEDHERSEPLPH